MAETVYVLCDNGSVMPHDLPLPAGIADRLSRGDLRLVNEDGSPLTEPQPEAAPEVVDEPVAARPAVNAAKAEWVAYAVGQGMSDEDADGMTKAALIEHFAE